MPFLTQAAADEEPFYPALSVQFQATIDPFGQASREGFIFVDFIAHDDGKVGRLLAIPQAVYDGDAEVEEDPEQQKEDAVLGEAEDGFVHLFW